MSKNDVDLTIGADPTGLQGALSRIETSLSRFEGHARQSSKNVEDGFKGLGESLDGFKSKLSGAFEFVGLAAAYEGINKLAEAMNQAAERAEQFTNLSQIVGTTTSEFQGLAATAAEVGVKQETLQRGMLTLSQRMTMARDGSQQAREQLAKVGISAADLSNPAFTAASALYAVAKSGAAAGDVQQVLGMRAVQLSAAFEKLRGGQAAMEAEGRKVNGLNQQEIADLTRYKESVSLMGIEYENLKGHMAAYLVEASGPLVQSFRNLGASMSGTIDLTIPLKAAFATLESIIIAVVNAFTALAGVIMHVVTGAVDAFTGLGRIMKDIFTGNWTALKTDAKDAFNIVKDDGAAAFNAYADGVKNTIGGVRDAWVKAFAPPGASGQESRAETGGGGTGGTHRGAGHENLAALRRVAEEKHRLVEQELRDMGKALDQEVEVAKIAYHSEYQARLSSLDKQLAAVKDAARQGEIPAEQAFVQERQILQEKLAAQTAYYEKLKALAVGNRVELAKLDAEEQKSQLDYLNAVDKAHEQTTALITRQWDQVGHRMASSWDRMFAQMMNGTFNFSRMLEQTFRQILLNFVHMETAQLAHHITTEAAKAEASRTSALIQGQAQKDGAEKGVFASGEAGLKKIMNDAYQAASGAYNATVGIPYVGPILAPVAAATAFAAVAAFSGGIASASGGYDIPAGVNPVTQLHQREMVLPAHLADTIRGLSGSGAGAGSVNVTMQHRGDLGQGFFLTHRDDIAAAINQVARERHAIPGIL